MNLAHATWDDVRDAEFEVAVLPWGATEAHNRHLPYGTDTIQSEAVAVAAAEEATRRGARVLVLPAVPFGVQTGQLEVPLCLNMNPSTQAAVLREHAEEVASQLGKAEMRANAGEHAAERFAANLGIAGERGKLGGFVQRFRQRIEIGFDRRDGARLAGELEQGRGITPR